MLLSFPIDITINITINILLEWSSIDDLCKLDTSYCKEHFRLILLNSYRCLIEIANKCINLTILNINCNGNITDKFIIEIANKCPLMTILAIIYSINNITYVSLIEITNKCPKLISVIKN
jgi:hypothetical protein